MRFDTCTQQGLSLTFKKCKLNNSSFFETQLKNILFEDSELIEVDFAYSNLSHSKFINCNLQDAIFDNTNLSYADLYSAYYFSINPTINRIARASFSATSLEGLLQHLDIEIVH